MRQTGANNFRNTLLACFEIYEHRAIALERLQGISEDYESEREILLECHARLYVIDHILAGLGWQIPTHPDLATHSQNLAIETSVTSLMTGHRRFLDYFGFERESELPLLVVEAKRPSLRLPLEGKGSKTHFNCHPASEKIAEYLQSRHESRNVDENLEAVLTNEWRGYLDDLRDYIRSVADVTTVPRRAIITNGEWLVLFYDPEQAFANEDARVDSTAILIFANRDQILNYYSEIYEKCSYTCLVNDSGIIRPRNLRSVISATDISYAMFGQRVLYCQDRTLYAHVPRIELTPVVHLCTKAGGVVSVESTQPCPFQLGLSNDSQIDEQYDLIFQSAEKLKHEIEQEMNIMVAIPLQDISNHYANTNAFHNLPGVKMKASTSCTWQEFVLATGTSPHFLTDSTSHRECSYHDSSSANNEGVLHEIGILTRPVIEPRAFFPSGSCFHCSHEQTYETKTINLTPNSRPQSGQRSGKDNEPFCELFQLDQVLCCRSCAFLGCCSQSDLFRLPCSSSG